MSGTPKISERFASSTKVDLYAGGNGKANGIKKEEQALSTFAKFPPILKFDTTFSDPTNNNDGRHKWSV